MARFKRVEDSLGYPERDLGPDALSALRMVGHLLDHHASFEEPGAAFDVLGQRCSPFDRCASRWSLHGATMVVAETLGFCQEDLWASLNWWLFGGWFYRGDDTIIVWRHERPGCSRGAIIEKLKRAGLGGEGFGGEGFGGEGFRSQVSGLSSEKEDSDA